MIGSRETKELNINHFILRRFTISALIMADNEILFVSLILLFHLPFCTCGKKRPYENPQRHSYFCQSTFHQSSAVHPPTCTLNKSPSALKGPLLSQEKQQSLHASSACVLLMERAAGRPCSCTHEQQLPVRGEILFQRRPRSSFHAYVPELSSCTNTLLLFHLS